MSFCWPGPMASGRQAKRIYDSMKFGAEPTPRKRP